MNREIKFRAWDGEAMRYGGFSLHATAGKVEPLAGLSTVTEDSPIMQFTGLTDKNGVEIYEGDILKSGRTSLNYQVIWDHYQEARFIGLCADPEKDFAMCPYSWYENEVIGNIYQSPELFK